MLNLVKNFLRDEEGLELSEYAVAAALILVGLVVAFATLGNTINNVIMQVVAAI
jgi:pilus assembly protein Flp/PilA